MSFLWDARHKWVNDTSSLLGHFVSSHKGREKMDRQANRGEEREKKKKMKEKGYDSAET